jgi:hypothetical protein
MSWPSGRRIRHLLQVCSDPGVHAHLFLMTGAAQEQPDREEYRCD